MSHNSGSTAPSSYNTPSAWVGWIAFAAAIMILLGSLHIFQGLVALFRDEVFVVSDALVVSVDYTAWGVVHIIGGLLILAAGFGVLAGNVWARTLGVIMALISAIVNVAFIGAYPFWSVIMVALDVVIILALTVHGSEIKAGD
jgi:hypothetical protein